MEGSSGDIQDLAERWRVVGHVLRRRMSEREFEALLHAQEVAADFTARDARLEQVIAESANEA